MQIDYADAYLVMTKQAKGTRVIQASGEEFEYEYTYKNVKRLTLRVKPNYSISLTMPWLTPLRSADKFILENIDWIKQKMERIEEREIQRQGEDREWIMHLGEKLPIVIKQADKVKIHIVDNTLEMNVRNPIERIDIEATVLSWRRFTAFYVYQTILRRIFPRIAKHIDNNYPNLKIRISKTRWGSYSPRTNSIMINADLIKMPTECIEYVIMHELCHIKYLDHSENFYSLLGEVMPDYREREKLIKQLSK